MSSSELSTWNTSYLTYPSSSQLYPSLDTFPHHVDEVRDATTIVYGELGSSWDRVTDESAYDDIIQATADLTAAIESIPVALDMVTRSSDGKTVNGAVVAEIIARYVTGQEGEFVKLTAGQIAANSIGASHIQAGAIDGTIITGATIRTSATNPRVQLDSTGLYAYNSSGSETFRMSSSDGSVWIRGDLGLSDSWSTTRFTDFVASTGTDYASDGFRWGSGLYFQVTDRSMLRHGSIGMVRSPASSDYNFSNQHGLRLQAPLASSTSNSAAPWCALWEQGWEVQTYNEVNARQTMGLYGITTRSDNWGLTLRNRYISAGDYSDQGFWAYAVNNGATSGYYFRQVQQADQWLAFSDYYYLRASSNYFLYRTSWNDTTARRISSRATSYFGFTDATSFYVYAGCPTTFETSRLMKLNVSGGTTASSVYAHDTQSGIHYEGHYAYVNSSGFTASGGTKNFAMRVPVLSEARGGMELHHSTTESPGAGIEYWATEDVPDSGLVVWALPDYVPYIASAYGARSVFVTPSKGTATAVLHDDLDKESGWYVEVRAEPGSRVNILVKMNRITENGDGEWEDNGFAPWRISDRGIPTAGSTANGGFGPLSEEETLEHERWAEEQLLAPYVDTHELKETLAAAGLTGAPLMRGYTPEGDSAHEGSPEAP